MDLQEFLRDLAQLATNAVLMSGNQNNPARPIENSFMAQNLHMNQAFGQLPSFAQHQQSSVSNFGNDPPSEKSKPLKSADALEKHNSVFSTTATDKMAEATSKEKNILCSIVDAENEHNKMRSETTSCDTSTTSTGKI